MSEQPTYWKHKETGDMCSTSPQFDIALWRNMKRIATGEVCDRVHITEIDFNYEPIPTPQAGEKWTGTEGDVVIKSVEPPQVHFTDGMSMILDDFMLNYRRVEDAPKKEHSYTIKPVANGAGYYLCSCGWRSKIEDDGDIFKPDRYSAKDDWDRHVAEATTTLLPEHLEDDTSKLTDMAIRRIEQIQKSAVAYVQNINSAHSLNSLITLCTMSQELRRRVIEVSRGDFDISALEIKPDCVHDWRQMTGYIHLNDFLSDGRCKNTFYCTKCLAYQEKLTP